MTKNFDNDDILIAKNKLRVWKKQIKILDENKKKFYLFTKQVWRLFQKQSSFIWWKCSKLNSAYPSYHELCENIKRFSWIHWCWSYKKEKYAINHEDLNQLLKQQWCS